MAGQFPPVQVSNAGSVARVPSGTSSNVTICLSKAWLTSASCCKASTFAVSATICARSASWTADNCVIRRVVDVEMAARRLASRLALELLTDVVTLFVTVVKPVDTCDDRLVMSERAEVTLLLTEDTPPLTSSIPSIAFRRARRRL